MTLNPIFPPRERNFSPAEQKRAAAILDDESRRLIEIDRARLLHSSAASAITLSELVGLSDEVASELTTSILSSAKDLSPSYHEYLNSLLSALVELYKLDKPIEAGVPTSLSALELPAEIEVEEAIEIPEYAGPPIKLEQEGRLFKHDEKSGRPMRRFLQDVISQDTLDPALLSLEEASLMTWQILDFYRRMPVPQATPERKAKQIERISKQVGLYEMPVSLKAMAGEVTSNSIGSTINTAKEKIAPIISPNVINMLARARKTLREELVADIFQEQEPTLTYIGGYSPEEDTGILYRRTSGI